MIDRYSLTDTKQLEERFNLSSGLPKGVRPTRAISPTGLATVLIADGPDIRAEVRQWGLVVNGSKNMHSVFRYKTFNIPSEKIMTKHSWEQAVRNRRCIIPMNGYYLLAGGKNDKRAFFVHLPDNEVFGVAGVQGEWTDQVGIVHPTFSMLTTDAPAVLTTHGARMPVGIARVYEAAWLDNTVSDTNTLYTMFRSFDPKPLIVQEVSTDVFSPKTDTSALIQPLSRQS